MENLCRGDHRAGEHIGRAPACVAHVKAVIDAGINNVRGRGVDVVEPAGGIIEPRGRDQSGRMPDRAAGQVKCSTGLRHHLGRRQVDGAAGQCPFLDRVADIAEFAADLGQAAGGVIAGLIVGRAGRHHHQLARVDADVPARQLAAVAVGGRVAQFEPLQVDLEDVGAGRQHEVGRAGDIKLRAALGQDPRPRADRDLAAGRKRQRGGGEPDAAAGGDLHPALILSVGERRLVVE